MALDFFLRPRDRLYERRLGKTERRFIRLCRKLPDWRRRSLANSAAVSGQEMNHWLFLNNSSLFRDQLERVAPDDARWLIRTWFAVGLAAFTIDESLPEITDEDWAVLDDVLARADLAGPPLVAEVERIRADLGVRKLYDDLVTEIRTRLAVAPDLEQNITLSILVAQMIDKADQRCRSALAV
ncbi:MAG: hypothetical protein JXQ27_05190 [Acidobacteria bacterium]|nr:hypothetical protein [Acidobacteriota bacterium]